MHRVVRLWFVGAGVLGLNPVSGVLGVGVGGSFLGDKMEMGTNHCVSIFDNCIPISMIPTHCSCCMLYHNIVGIACRL